MANGPIQFKVPKSKPELKFDFPYGFAGGMNISVSPDQIAPNQSPDMLNMTLDGGVLTKRYGFARIDTWGKTAIRGMHLFHRIDAPTEFLFAQGGQLWKLNESGELPPEPDPPVPPVPPVPPEPDPNGDGGDGVNDPPDDEGPFYRLPCGDKTFADSITTFFTANDKVYFFTGNEYLVYDGEDVQEVAGYVPVLTKGGTGEGPGYFNEPLNYLTNSWWESYSPDGQTTEFPLSMQGLNNDEVVIEEYTSGGTVTHVENDTFAVDRTTGVITFTTAPGEGLDTIKIKAAKDGLNDRTLVTNCTMAVIYGGRNDTRVFIAGNPDSPNLRLSSGLTEGVMNPEYFPEDTWELIGSDEDPITGFGKVADILFTYKKRSRYYSDVDGPYDDGQIIFPTYPVNDEHGCIAPRTVQPVQDGIMALSEEGITWSAPSVVRGQFNTKIISRNINGRSGLLNENAQRMAGLLDNSKKDLEAAHAIVYNNKYWLHVGSEVWVLDLDYSNIIEGICCWYRFDGVPSIANCFLEQNEKLYIGSNESGSIHRSRDEFDRSDEKYKEDYIESGILTTFFDAYWTSPVLYGDAREWIKKFRRMFLTFLPSEVPTDVILTLITEDGDEDIILPQESTYFNYAYAYYDRFGYGVETAIPATQSEKIGFKGEYIQWRIRNGWNNSELNFSYDAFDYGRFNYDNLFFESLRIAAQAMTYTMRKMVK